MGKLKKFVFKLYKILFSIAGKILPKNENVIIFESFLGKQYSDSPRAIYEYLLEKSPHYKMYWSVERKSLPKFKNLNVRYVKRFSIKWLFLMNYAKYWVTNSRLPIWIPKPKGTIYVQTWHGTPLKRLALDMKTVRMPGTNTEKYKRNFVSEAKKWDYLISPNEYSSTIFKRAFQFENALLETGYPRNDYLVNHNTKEQIERIKRELNLPKDKKVILYAPTWRDHKYYGKGRYKFEMPLDLEILQEALSSEYILLLRMHYLIAENLDLSKYEGFIFDMSLHEDIRELYIISDILITDYSSVFFDYANLKRPMIFYVYDLEEYENEVRGFYFDLKEEAPGVLVRNTNDLIRAIMEKHQVNQDKIDQFYNKFCYLEDGKSTERVVKQIFNVN